MLDDLKFTQNVAGQENKCNNKSKKEKKKVKKIGNINNCSNSKIIHIENRPIRHDLSV